MAYRTRRARYARRRQRRMDRVEHDLSPEHWDALKASWGGCAYCGAIDVPLQRDCVLPISRGGRYTLDNIAPACRSCNASKCNQEVTSWLRRKRLDEPAFLLRHLEVTAAFAIRFPAEGRASRTPDGAYIGQRDEPVPGDASGLGVRFAVRGNGSGGTRNEG